METRELFGLSDMTYRWTHAKGSTALIRLMLPELKNDGSENLKGFHISVMFISINNTAVIELILEAVSLKFPFLEGVNKTLRADILFLWNSRIFLPRRL